MKDFLKLCKDQINEDNSKCLVIPNENHEFGTAVSALCLAFYLQNRKSREEDPIEFYIPVLAIDRDYLATRTDFLYYLDQFGIKSEDLLVKDDILAMEDFEKIILVDYYDPFSDLTFDTKLVKQVFCSGDQEVKFIQAENLDRFFTPAKFIASVVAEFILRNLLPQNITDDDKWTLRLLYDCIVYGTNICTCVNYPEDSRIIEELEAIIGCRADPLYGETLVDSLTQANAEYSQLNSYQLLLKYSTNDFYYGRKCITFVDLPMGMQEFIEKPSYHVGLVEFAEVMKINIYIIVAFTVDEQNNNEDNFIGVINVNDSILYKRVVDKLLYDSKLKLCYQSRFPYLNGKWYRHHCHNKNDIKKCLKELY